MRIITRRLSVVWAHVGVSTLLLGVPPVARASAILFSNFGPGLSYDTSTGNPVGNDLAGFDEWQGESFKPVTTATLSSIEIALSAVAFSSLSPVTVALWSDVGNRPGAILERFANPVGAIGPLGSNNPALVLNSSLFPVLSVGSQYWVTAASPLTSSYSWNFNTTGELADHAISIDTGATWFTAPGGFYTPGAFQVDGNPVPEPGTLTLIASVGLLFIRFFIRVAILPHIRGKLTRCSGWTAFESRVLGSPSSSGL